MHRAADHVDDGWRGMSMGIAVTVRNAARSAWRRLGTGGRVAVLGVLTLAAVYAAGAATSPGAPPTQTPGAGAVSTTPETPPAQALDKTDSSGGQPAAPGWIDSLAKLLDSISWALVVLVLLIVFRKPVGALLKALETALADRGVTVDVASVKIQVSERAIDPWEERSPGFSRSLLEIEEQPVRERSSILSEIAPQLLFPLSSYVARRLAASRAGATAAAAMRAAREDLASACRTARTFQDVRRPLVAFVQWFERTRFLDADLFGELLTRHPVLAEGVRGLRPADPAREPDDFLILHAAGVAYAQREEWTPAGGILDALVWKDQVPLYLWAADTWLACAYHRHLQKFQEQNPGLDIDAPEFFDTIDDLLGRAERVAGAMTAAGPTPRSGYYRRELLKVVGSIASILGEASRTPDKKAAYLDRALQALAACTKTIDGDPPSPLDHNNLADVYRQIGDHRRQIDDAAGSAEYYALAHRELDVACPPGDPPDPAFCNTRALIFAREKQPLKGWLALERYGEAEAAAADRPDLVQHVENQILAARLAAAVESDLPLPCLGLTVAKLEAARGLVERRRDLLGPATARTLQAQTEELLGYAYLQVPGLESRAADAYNRLRALGDEGAPAEVRWQRRLGRAKALSRLAGSQRRAFSAQVARQFWTDGQADLATSAEAVKPFGLDAGAASIPRRVRHVRLLVDTVTALQAVAEEGVREGERIAAKNLLEQENALLAVLGTALTDVALRQGLGRALPDVESRVRECAARRCYLLARILLRDDPSFSDAGLADKVEANFTAARGASEDLDCRIDLELGEFMLAAALAGQGDVRARYERAIASLELAARRNAPALRGETVRALAEAYARRPAVLRKAKASKASS
jgi:hypothetical protein